MKNLPLNQLGPHETAPGVVNFGVLLPWISATNGNRLFVKVIHERNQFIQAIQPLSFELQHNGNADYGDIWSVTVDFNITRDGQSASNFDSPARYVYQRETTTAASLIGVNFTDVEQSVPFVFTRGAAISSNCTVWITLPPRRNGNVG